jgi:hypothetical protein
MEPSTTAVDWLAQFPPQAQPLIAAWFRLALRQHPASPEALLACVETIIGTKYDWVTRWGSRQACTLTLLALKHQRPLALAYAATLLTPEPRHG